MLKSVTKQLRTPKMRARPKNKAQDRVVVRKNSESSVAMSEGTASSAHEEAVREEDLWTLECEPLGAQVEGPLGEKVRSLEKRAATSGQCLQLSEKERVSSKERVKRFEEEVEEFLEIPSAQVSSGTAEPEDKKRSSAKEPKEVVVTFLNLLRDSVVPLLKYLDGKQEKYTVSEEAKFYVELLRNKNQSKRAASMKIAKDVARVVGECAARTATLQVHEEQLWAKKMECKVLWLGLVKQKELREEEELRTKGFWREIATMNTMTMDLRRRIKAQREALNVELRCVNELTTSLAEQTQKYKAELASWMKKLIE
ncbi:hypothetical protein AXG93_2272s1020 [Marchantia polymorpha subsp. ruderalis]|uniref:Uncharacterized protein n=1 Tax=Marchantia polymorpha subsp. ruderalis TaxID=1480154 RepID=A0A176VRY4_MARPO|nr:hypothetical protein AXG93_2272s1020 [Marchantia polymorpha subsp. ruderalis]